MRLARPVADIALSLRFYVETADWHLEFTSQAGGSAVGAPTAEDLLVLYLSADQLHAARARLKNAGVQSLRHENPYWARVNALVFRDPDGYLLVLCPVEAGG